MLRILFFINFLFLAVTGYSSNTINIKGYYVIRSRKADIVNDLNNNVIAMLTNVSIPGTNDTKVTYFVPLEINDSIINTDKTISKAVENLWTEENEGNDTFYLTPIAHLRNMEMEKEIKKYFNMEINLSKEICVLRSATHSSFYFINKNNEKYLYTCIYIEGVALETTIPNRSDIRPSCIHPYDIKLGIEYLKLYYIIDILNYTPIVDIPGLEIWFPYISK